MPDNNTTTIEDDLEVETNLEVDQDSQQPEGEEPKGKSKAENFDGVVKKMNSYKKRIKELESAKQKEQMQPDTDQSAVDQLRQEINELKSKMEKSTFENQLNNTLEKANILPKFTKIAKPALESIAEDNDLDLSDSQDLKEAVKLLSTEYPEFVQKTPTSTGVPNGQTTSKKINLDILNSDDGYLSLSPEERKEYRKKIFI